MSAPELHQHASTIVRPGVQASLPEFLAFANTACVRANVPHTVGFAVRLAVEEVCTNIIKHGYGGRSEAGPIALTISTNGNELTVTISDRAPLFRPDDAAPPDIESEWDVRALGGLGWYLVRSSVDEVRHEPAENGGNVVTLVKRMSSPINPEATR